MRSIQILNVFQSCGLVLHVRRSITDGQNSITLYLFIIKKKFNTIYYTCYKLKRRRQTSWSRSSMLIQSKSYLFKPGNPIKILNVGETFDIGVVPGTLHT